MDNLFQLCFQQSVKNSVQNFTDCIVCALLRRYTLCKRACSGLCPHSQLSTLAHTVENFRKKNKIFCHSTDLSTFTPLQLHPIKHYQPDFIPPESCPQTATNQKQSSVDDFSAICRSRSLVQTFQPSLLQLQTSFKLIFV